MERAEHWWEEGSIYQILVPSFQDTTGNGMGDLRGILERIDYVQWLGVRGIWLSPIYPSPMRDLGYDVTDHKAVHPDFGTLDDFDELLAEVHRREMKLILDWIPNHTSAEHPWFVASRSSREDPQRDWYLWRDPRPDGSPPTNWVSVFGGNVWTWDEATGQYYMHTFLDQQPDLNWRNPEVQEAMIDVMRFWLDRGVDGFRVDATSLFGKDKHFRDNPPNPDFGPDDAPDNELLPHHTRDQPLVHVMLAKFRCVLDAYPGDRLLAGELFLPIEKLVKYYGRTSRPELHLPLNLSLAFTSWSVPELTETIAHYERCRPAHGWPTWTISTHDCPRIAARAPGERARVVAMLMYTLPGTPTHYYGEEIGMEGVEIPQEEALDPQGRRTGRNRDPERTPMQWDAGPQGGFTGGQPWLPIGGDVARNNVAAQRDDPHSMLTLYRRLIALRRAEPALVRGRYEPLEPDTDLLVYRLELDARRLLVALNGSAHAATCPLDMPGRVLLSTRLDREEEEVREALELRPDEGVIVALEEPSSGTA